MQALRRRLVLAAVLLSSPRTASAEEPTSSERPEIHAIRWMDDFRFLRTYTGVADPWDPVKDIRLAGDRVYVSVGGDLRLRYEGYRRPVFGLEQPGLQAEYFRALPFADIHVGPIRVFTQVGAAFDLGKDVTPGPLDEDRLDLQQGFVEAVFEPRPRAKVVIRVGRQEMVYGSARLFSARIGPNVRQSFDVLRLEWRSPGVTFDAFAGTQVQPKIGVFDDVPTDVAKVVGGYATIAVVDKAFSVDAYYIGTQRDGRVYADVKGRDSRHSIGSRLFGTSVPLSYDFEGVVQAGTIAGSTIAAWTLASQLALVGHAGPVTLRTGTRADVTSGDRRPSDGTVGTFSALFPNLKYYSEAGLLSPSNISDVHGMVGIGYANASLVLDWNLFWRTSTRDAVYGTANFPTLRADVSRDRFVGHQPTGELTLSFGPHLELVAYYAHFFSGAYVDAAGGSDADFFGTWADYRF